MAETSSARKRSKNEQGEKLTVKADETAFNLFKRLQIKPFITGMEFLDVNSGSGRKQRGLFSGDVVELYGRSGAGKTEVLMNAAVQFALPTKLYGAQKTAIYFDLDSRLDLSRLQVLVRQKIRQSSAFKAGWLGTPVNPKYQQPNLHATLKGEDALFEAHVQDCLSRIKIIRCSNNLELAAYFEIFSHQLAGSTLVLILIDSLGSFYWKDKLTESCSSSALSYQTSAMKGLSQLIKLKSLIVIAAKPVMMPTKFENDHKEYTSGAWQKLITSRLFLFHQVESQQFNQDINNKNNTVINLRNQYNASEKNVNWGQQRHAQRMFFIITDDGIQDLQSK